MAKVRTVEWKPGETVFGGSKGVATWRPYKDKKTGKSLITTPELENAPLTCEQMLLDLLAEKKQLSLNDNISRTNQPYAECTLSASNSYVETMTFKQISLQPGLNELVISTQLLNAKNPQEKRVKAQIFVEKVQLVAMRDAINKFLLDDNEEGQSYD